MQTPKIDALDQLRFFAAMLVLLTHFRASPDLLDGTHGIEKALKAWVQHGSWGVSIFLVLSAFLFTLNFLERGEEPYTNFIRKRLFRIFPMYCIIGILLMTQNRAEWSVDDLLTFLTFQVNAGDPMTGYGNDQLPIGPIWTIGVEFQFYLIFPFLFAALNPSSNSNILRLIGVVAFVIFLRFLLSIWTLGPAVYFNAYHTLLGRFDQFVIGMIAARVFVQFRSKLSIRTSAVGLIVTLILATLYLRGFKPMSWPKNTYSLTIEALIAASIIITMIGCGGIPSKLGKAIAYLGAASYSIYLLHLPVGRILLTRFGDVTFPALGFTGQLVLLVILPTIIVSILAYQCIEKPFMALGRRENKMTTE